MRDSTGRPLSLDGEPAPQRTSSRPVRWLALLALGTLLWAPTAGAVGADTDGDGVADAADNCAANVNGHQEDSDGDGTGDVCDSDTINPILEATAGAAPALHARTPWYRLRVSAANGFEMGTQDGLGTAPTPGIGIEPPPDEVIRLRPVDLVGVGGGFAPGSPSVRQSSWQSLTLENLFAAPGGPPPVRGFAASYANGAAFGYELDLATIPVGTDAGVEHELVLPAGWTLDTREIDTASGVGRVSILAAGAVRFRVSAAELIAHGRRTEIADSPTFHGLQRLSDELQDSARTATVGPPDLVGTGFYGGVEAPLVQTSYSLETMKDGALGTIEVVAAGASTWRLSMVVPAALLDRNRATSSQIFVGFRISALAPVDLGAGTRGAPPPPVHGRHLVFFDDESAVTGSEAVVTLHNALGTFDEAAPDYGLFPDDGGSAADYDVLSQQQTGFGCAGCTMTLQGDTLLDFPGGGVGVGIAPGPRVGPADPCLISDPLNEAAKTGRCAVGVNKRGSFSADKLTVRGSMSGLVAGESDVSLDELLFFQQHDPNVTDPTLLHSVIGLGCAAEKGVRIGVNPSNGDVLGNVPLDLAICDPADVGRGVCLPRPLSMPASSGLCNLSVGRVELLGMGSVDNPLGTDLTMPSGVGVALHVRSGVGRIGDRAYDSGHDACLGALVSQPSVVKGFEAMASFSGGGNVAPATGEPLVFDARSAVLPNVFCITNVLGDELGVGLVVGSNTDVRASHLQIEDTLLGSVHLSNGVANVETVATTTAAGLPCPSIDGTTCRTPMQELACPGCVQTGLHLAAATSAGKSAPTRLEVTDSVLGADEFGVTSGGDPSLPPLVLGPDLVATGGGLTMARRLAGLLRTPVQVAWGPDTMFEPDLLELTLRDNNIGVHTAAFSVDNLDSRGGTRSLEAVDNCYTPDGSSCLTSADGLPVVAAAAGDPGISDLNENALREAASSPNPTAGVVYVPEPSLCLGVASGAVLLALLGRIRGRHLGSGIAS